MDSVKRQAQAFVVAQFSLIALVILACGKVPAQGTGGGWLLAAGLLLGAWTLAHNRPHNFNIVPLPREGAQLCTDGPYEYIRHPMYTAVLLALLGVVIMTACPVSLVGWCALALVLDRKAAMEETLLSEKYAEYSDYASARKRFVPALY